jgi:hypothetical protein
VKFTIYHMSLIQITTHKRSKEMIHAQVQAQAQLQLQSQSQVISSREFRINAMNT